jgi:hypothetical protein
MLATAAENILDKAAFAEIAVGDKIMASFIRVAAYVLLAILAGMSGVTGKFHPTTHWAVFAMAPWAALMAAGYSHMLETVEATMIGVAGYLAPLAFLVVDLSMADTGMSWPQAGGVVLLSMGGAAFVAEPGKLRLRGDLTPKTAAALLFSAAYGGCSAYLFKHLNATEGVDPLGFYASVWSLAAVILLAAAVVRSRGKCFGGGWILGYTKRASVAKFMDLVSSVLFGAALTRASVSQVAGLDAAYPLVLLLSAALAQSCFGLRVAERLDRRAVAWKSAAAVLLAGGAGLVA